MGQEAPKTARSGNPINLGYGQRFLASRVLFFQAVHQNRARDVFTTAEEVRIWARITRLSQCCRAVLGCWLAFKIVLDHGNDGEVRSETG